MRSFATFELQRSLCAPRLASQMRAGIRRWPAFGLLVVSALALAADPIPVKPGKFEVTLTMSMGGQESSTTRTRCILAADLEDPELVFSHEGARNLPRTWTISNLKVGGGKVDYVVTPSGLPPATVSGTVSEQAFAVERTVKGAPGASRIVGKRVGECKK